MDPKNKTARTELYQLKTVQSFEQQATVSYDKEDFRKVCHVRVNSNINRVTIFWLCNQVTPI